MVNPGPSSAVIVPKGILPGMPELEPYLESRNIIELRKHCQWKIKNKIGNEVKRKKKREKKKEV